MSRIAMVGACPFPVPQGSQVLLRDTAMAMRDQGHEVHLVVYGYGFSIDSDMTGDGIFIQRSTRLPSSFPGARQTKAGPSFAKPFLDWSLQRTLRRVVAAHRIDIVHAHNYEGLLVALAAGKHPIVYHAHNAMADELPFFLPGGRILGQVLDAALPRRADWVIAPHERLAAYLQKCGCSANKVAVIPPMLDAALFETEPMEDKLPPVLYAGNRDKYQNLELLRRAMKRVRAEIPEARLIIASAVSDPFPEAEVMLVSDFQALRNVLKQDAVFACPRVSWSGYPIKLLNAMAAAKPSVACLSAAHPLTDETDGLVVADNDEEAFARALMRLLCDAALRQRLGQNARQTVLERHNHALIAAQIECLYEKALLNR